MNAKAIAIWLLTGGAWTIVGILSFFLKTYQPFIKHGIGLVKNVKVKKGLEIADHYATEAVTTLAQYSSLSNSERKSKAISDVATKLSARGINVSANEISEKVQNSYEYAKKHGFLKDVPTKQTSNTDPQANNQANQVNSVINPQPVNNQQNNSQQGSSDDEKAKQLAQQVQNNPKAQSLLKGMNGNGQNN